MIEVINREKLRDEIIKKIEEISGENVYRCYQCGKCSAGCPMVHEMDILPSQIIRYIQMGLIEELLNSNSIWLCASCMTCHARCPKGVDLSRISEAVRQVLLRNKQDYVKVKELPKEKRVVPPIAFISSLRKFTC